MTDILIINGSASLNGDTAQLLDKFTAGIPHTRINLASHYILPYNYENQYPAEDQFQLITKEILYHKHLIFATPIYWYAMSGRMKTLFDRLTDWVTVDQETGRSLKGKTMQLIVVGTDGTLPDGLAGPFYQTANYLEMVYHGHLYFNSGETVTDETLATLRDSFFKLSS